MERVKEGGAPYFNFGSLPILRAGKTPKIPFFAPNPTDTLATQAIRV